jgi:hypothetical protein
MINKEYTTVPFPFKQLEPPEIYMHKEWNVQDISGWINSWSAVLRYKDHHQKDPVPDFEKN